MILRVLILTLLVTAQTAVAQLTPEHVTTLETVTSVALSPDGRHVAYTLARPRAPEDGGGD